jgi:hypothetical protein
MVSMKWQECFGMGGRFGSEYYIAFRFIPAGYSEFLRKSGRFRSEYLATFPRNGWQVSFGTGGRFDSEYLFPRHLQHPMFRYFYLHYYPRHNFGLSLLPQFYLFAVVFPPLLFGCSSRQEYSTPSDPFQLIGSFPQ